MVCVLTPLITDAGAARVATNGLLALNVPMPIDVPPSLKVTVPVGVPAPGLVTLTVAVNVTLWPNTDALTALVTVVVVLAVFTVCRKFADVLPLKFVSGL